MSIDYSQKIPNNVNLADDRALNRALEHWQPNYVAWWNEMGPEGTQGAGHAERRVRDLDLEPLRPQRPPDQRLLQRVVLDQQDSIRLGHRAPSRRRSPS